MRTEVCVDAVSGVHAAVAGGADRVEVCSALEVGGVTPSAGLVRASVAVGLPVHVLIRCRPGDFVFSDDEIAVMADDVAAAVAAGASGVVLGALTRDGAVDVAGTRVLMAAAGSASVTFHRAFDLAADPFTALEAVSDLGVQRILTSGRAARAIDGADLLAALVRRSAADGPVVLAGGGVRPETVAALIARTGVTEVHFSARGPAVGTGRSEPPRAPGPAKVRMGTADDGTGHLVTDPDLVAATVRAARNATVLGRSATGR